MECTQTLDGIQFANMLRAGARNLRAHTQSINDLNVFPIPDGDTGDNMMLTLRGGVEAIREDATSLSVAARQAADGMLLSARGNSGVILSQLFDGIAEGFSGLERADQRQLGHAMGCGVRHAYSAVMKPAEGTILTVARNAAEYAQNRDSRNMEEYIDHFLTEAKRTLNRTPDMLPVLKKAGVGDSGGAGLVYILEGMRQGVSGEVEASDFRPAASAEDLDLSRFTEDSVLEFGYCTELLLRLQTSKIDLSTFQVNLITDYLQEIGDSVVAFQTGTMVKIHVHTMTPDKVLAFCQQYGEFLTIKIENMSLQHNNTVQEAPVATQRKPYGVVAVCAGEGIRQLFLERGADAIVEGGQSQNPSTEDFLQAFRQLNAETILVLPNNSNIILTAKQAAGMYPDAEVRVVESRTVGDGYAALAMLDTDSGDTEQIVGELTEAMEGVVTASVSRCVRNVELQDIAVKKGDYIGFVDKEILTAGESRFQTVCDTIDKAGMSQYDICILIWGGEVNQEEAARVEAYIHTRHAGKEVYVLSGKQEVFDYILILQ